MARASLSNRSANSFNRRCLDNLPHSLKRPKQIDCRRTAGSQIITGLKCCLLIGACQTNAIPCRAAYRRRPAHRQTLDCLPNVFHRAAFDFYTLTQAIAFGRSAANVRLRHLANGASKNPFSALHDPCSIQLPKRSEKTKSNVSATARLVTSPPNILMARATGGKSTAACSIPRSAISSSHGNVTLHKA